MIRLTRLFIALSLPALVEPSGVIAQDAYPENIAVPLFVAMGAAQPISGYVRNAAPTPLTGFNTGWRWNNGPVQKGNFLNLGGGITSNNMAKFTHPIPFQPSMAGKGTLKVWVEGSGDNNRRNDTLTFSVTVLDQWVSKRILMEVRTSLNCHNCQMAKPKVDAMLDDPGLVLAKYHYRDDLTATAPDRYFNQYTTEFTPAGVIDQGEFGRYTPNPNHSQWQNQLNGRVNGVSPVLCWVEPVLDSTTNRLHVTVAASFTTAMQGDFTVNALVKANNVYATGGSGKPWHHGVVRAMLAGPDGDGEVIPEQPVPGITYTVTYEVNMPDGVKASDLCITGYVTENKGLERNTLNARDASVNVGVVVERTAMLPAVSWGAGSFLSSPGTPMPDDAGQRTERSCAILSCTAHRVRHRRMA